MRQTFVLSALALLCGCARVEFQPRPSDDALTYREPTPYLLRQQAADCTVETKVVSLPGQTRGLKLQPGYGSSKLSVTLTPDGILTNVGQEVDTKVPETITAVTGLTKAFTSRAAKDSEPKPKCQTRAALYPIVDGRVDIAHPTPLSF
jgi:hypothetical protein